jgi:hypothetical protein
MLRIAGLASVEGEMLNRYRLTGLGWFWLNLLHVINLVMVLVVLISVGAAVYNLAAPSVPGRGFLFMLRDLERVVGILSAWSSVAVLLAVLIWTESGKMTPDEEAQWRKSMSAK